MGATLVIALTHRFAAPDTDQSGRLRLSNPWAAKACTD